MIPTSLRALLAGTAFAALAPCLAAAQSTGPTETILHSFAGPDGAHPLGGVTVIQGASGPVLLGTAYSGGTGDGVLFSLSGTTFTNLHNFVASEGKFPQASVTQAPDGTLYGTLSGGGSTTQSKDGFGSVYAVSPKGKVRVVHKFQGPEGGEPIGPVSLDAAGDLIGTTQLGGSGAADSGVVYKITPAGTATALVDFSKRTCMQPLGPVDIDAAGNISGTGWMNHQAPFGCAWTFPAGGKTARIDHQFNNRLGGREPRGGVVTGIDGLLYGTAYYRGNTGPGTLFKLAADGTETVLHSFTCGADGGYPAGGLISDGHGLLFGTATGCGAGGGGVVFSYDTVANVFTVLHSFTVAVATDGYTPTGPLALDAQGNLYGTTEYGGANGLGIVYEITR